MTLEELKSLKVQLFALIGMLLMLILVCLWVMINPVYYI